MVLRLAINKLLASGKLSEDPLINQVAALSCGVVEGVTMADLNYSEDSNADIDSNFVMNDKKEFVEIQCSAEKSTLTKSQFEEIYDMATSGILTLFDIQKESLKSAKI